MSSLWVLLILLQPASQPTQAPATKPAAAPATQPATPKATAAAWTTLHRGAPFTMTDRITMDALMSDAKTYAGKTVRVDGVVSAVCVKKGCWMTLGGSDKTARARITFKNYGFFVPLDCAGSKTSVEGVVELKTLSAAERAHLAEDAGKSVDQVPENEIRLVATAVELNR
jgi:hypothetical protein